MKYTQSHEWIEIKDGVGTVGVSDHAQEELGDIVYVELPTVGETVKAGEEAAVLESTKAAADVYAPVSGEIVEVNEQLQDNSSLVNSSPQDQGWIYKIKLSNESELEKLMDEAQYKSQFEQGKA
jgi:glycine cleavage system H protein